MKVAINSMLTYFGVFCLFREEKPFELNLLRFLAHVPTSPTMKIFLGLNLRFY